MARRWTTEEELRFKAELETLYLKKNLTIAEIGRTLNIAESSVYDRLVRLGIPSCRSQKKRFNNRRTDVQIPKVYSRDLAELFGVLLGDGHISYFQVIVTLGTKEMTYARYVKRLIARVFGGVPKISIQRDGNKTVYLGSTEATGWLLANGLVKHKVHEQVDIPAWIFQKPAYMRAFLRGFFDTDGSVYRLRFGVQLAFINYSRPLLRSLHRMLQVLGYNPSAISGRRIYITRIPSITAFFKEVDPANQKHQCRFKIFMRR